MVLVKHIVVIAATMVVSRAVRADMVPLSDRDIGSQCTTMVTSDCPAESVLDDSVLFSCLVAVDLDRLPVGPLVDAQTGVAQADTSQPLCILADQQDSLGLSLYALLFVGLCKAASHMKIVSIVAVPACWRDGSWFEIAHRLNLSPGDLYRVCASFVSSDRRTKDSLPRYRQETIGASWRDSQFTPIALAPRGPPLRCHSSS